MLIIFLLERFIFGLKLVLCFVDHLFIWAKYIFPMSILLRSANK